MMKNIYVFSKSSTFQDKYEHQYQTQVQMLATFQFINQVLLNSKKRSTNIIGVFSAKRFEFRNIFFEAQIFSLRLESVHLG